MEVLDEMESLRLQSTSPQSWSCGEGFCTNPDMTLRPWGEDWGSKQQHPWRWNMIIVRTLSSAYSLCQEMGVWYSYSKPLMTGCRTLPGAVRQITVVFSMGAIWLFENEYLPDCAGTGLLRHKQALCYLCSCWTCTCFSCKQVCQGKHCGSSPGVFTSLQIRSKHHEDGSNLMMWNEALQKVVQSSCVETVHQVYWESLLAGRCWR